MSVTREEFDAHKAKLDSFEKEHREFHSSRRGTQGVAGPQGEVGPQGPPANHQEVAEIAAEIVTKRVENRLQEAAADTVIDKAAIRWAVIQELRESGFIDAAGKAVPGPVGKAGRDGAASQVPGPRGQSIVGPAGKDGVDGRDGRDGRDVKIAVGYVTTGETASITLREENGVQVFDFVLPRGERGSDGKNSTVPGPQGPKGDSIVGPVGPEGLPGLPGSSSGLSRDQVIALVHDINKRMAGR